MSESSFVITDKTNSSELISEAITKCIDEKKDAFGILITTLTDFSVEKLIHNLGLLKANGRKLRLAVEGLGDPTYLTQLAVASGFMVPEEFDTTLRAAGKWRNKWKETGTRIAIARGRQPNLHT